MKKAAKRLTVLFVVLASLVASQNTAYAAVARKELPLKLHKQNTPVWCWGAAIAMVADYTQNFDVKDCEVLAEYDMRLGGRGLCCLNAPECVRSGQPNEIASILGGIFGVMER